MVAELADDGIVYSERASMPSNSRETYAGIDTDLWPLRIAVTIYHTVLGRHICVSIRVVASDLNPGFQSFAGARWKSVIASRLSYKSIMPKTSRTPYLVWIELMFRDSPQSPTLHS